MRLGSAEVPQTAARTMLREYDSSPRLGPTSFASPEMPQAAAGAILVRLDGFPSSRTD